MLEELLSRLYAPITERLDEIMASAEQLQQQIDDTKQSLQDAIERVQADVDNLRNQEAGIDPADLDPISQGLSELKASLDALDPDPSNPAPESAA
jgi:hypothetical protein